VEQRGLGGAGHERNDIHDVVELILLLDTLAYVERRARQWPL